MNFGRGFNNGFRYCFNKNKSNFSSYFNKANNNKYIFNLFNSSTNGPSFRINFANKYFIDTVNFMKNSTAISCGRNFICKKLSGEIKEGSESDFSEFEFKNLIWGDNLTMLNGLFVIKSGK